MKQEEFTAIIIEAEEGHLLTQAADVEITERIVCRKVALGRYDSPENWKEITEEEAAGIRAEQKAARDAAKVAIQQSGAKITQQEPKHTESGDSDSEKGS